MNLEEELQHEPQTMFTAAQAAQAFVAFAAENAARCPTGYSLDERCGCVGPGEMALLWARSAAGKSTLMLNIIGRTPDIATVVFNMDMTPMRQTAWLISMTNELSTPLREVEHVLGFGDIDERYPEVRGAFDNVQEKFPTLTFDSPRTPPTIDDLKRAVERAEDGHGSSVRRVFIDHLTLMKAARDYEGVTQIAAKLHQWALETGIALFVVQQTGRGGSDVGRNDGHLPVTLSSGVFAGEHDADWIFGLYRPEKDPKFLKTRKDFRGKNAYEEYEDMLDEKRRVQNLAKFQLIKNRPYGELEMSGVDLWFTKHDYRLIEEKF